MQIQGLRRFGAARGALIALSTLMALGSAGAFAASTPAPEKTAKPSAASPAKPSGPVANSCSATLNRSSGRCTIQTSPTCPAGRRPHAEPLPAVNPTHCSCQCR